MITEIEHALLKIQHQITALDSTMSNYYNEHQNEVTVGFMDSWHKIKNAKDIVNTIGVEEQYE